MTVSRVKNAAFTLVELLVVIAILGILMGLLLPAVGAVRESMRRTQCKNNLAQIGKAAQAHLTLYGHFPSSGWGYLWVGDPDRGVGARQPGGWIYNLLPFMSLDMIHDIGKSLPSGDPDPNSAKSNDPNSPKGLALAEAQSAVIPSLICPTRRRPVAYPASGIAINAAQPQPVKLSKTDYAANGGSVVLVTATGGPPIGCLKTYPTCSTPWSDQSTFNGISGERSEVQSGHVPDGLSNVFLAGEKYLDPNIYNTYSTGAPGAENNCALQGNGYDTNRWVAAAPLHDVKGTNTTTCNIFGSAHSQGFQMVFCDGSVKLLNFKIDLPTYQSLGVRNDGTYSENF